jgi:octaprenyl-diphosphate synthase
MNFPELSDDIKKVNRKIEDSFTNNSEQVRNIFYNSYLFKGKKIRPIILILANRLFNNGSSRTNESLYTLAAGVELLHCASLIHDDINDASQVRRGLPTINATYGNTMAQILGDLLFVKSFELCAQFNDEIVQKTAQSCSNIAEGEILQLHNKNNVDISKETILKIEEYKTASVFGASAYCGACLAKAKKRDKKSLFSFGINFGLAFQLVDDILDYTGSTKQIGKNIYQDLSEGKITLPLYFILNDHSVTDKKALFRKLKKLSNSHKTKELEKLLEKTGAIEKTFLEVQNFCTLAKKDLVKFDSKELESLVDIYSMRKY